MSRAERMVSAGRELLARQPEVSDEQLRAWLLQEFSLERDPEVALLRSGLWPLAILARLFAGSAAARDRRVHRDVNAALEQLHAERTARQTLGDR